MKELEIGTKKHTVIIATDKPEFGASHIYDIKAKEGKKGNLPLVFTTAVFQKGPIKEHGVNGIHNEDLIAIVIDRLQGFQNTDFKCRENAIALTKLEETLMWLRSRTNDRENRGVEGTHKI